MRMDRDARALELQLPLHHLRSAADAAKCLRLMTGRAFGICGNAPEVDAESVAVLARKFMLCQYHQC
jgi:hypothetical protein